MVFSPRRSRAEPARLHGAKSPTAYYHLLWRQVTKSDLLRRLSIEIFEIGHSGLQVVQNQPLAIINGDHILADGQHLETLLLAEYQQQKQALLRQLQRGGHITDAELELLQEQQLSLKQKIQQLSLLRLRQQANIAQLQVHKKRQPIEAANQADKQRN